MKLIIFSLCLLIGASLADYEKFKKCNDSNFCLRCRDPKQSEYNFVATSRKTETTSTSFEIVNTEGIVFVATLRAVENDIFRVEIDEKTPLTSKTRYRVTEALVETPLVYKTITVTENATNIVVAAGTNKAVVKLTPFSIDFYHGDVLATTVNGKGLLRYEHLRPRPGTIEANELEMWEEEFYNELDVKANGPEAIAVDFTFPESEVLFGIPEHADDFALKKTVGSEPYRLYNSDVPYYAADSRMALYGSIPVIYGHGTKQTVGIFWHNSADTFIDIHDDKTSHFMSEAGIIDFFVLLGPKPENVFTQYTKLTGVGNLPQLYSLGYHQSRWSYMTQEEVIEVVDEFDKNDLQLDTMWLDIDYTDGKRYFTWNPTNFSKPLEMIANLTSTGRHLTFIIDPHIFKDPNYFFYTNASANNYYIKTASGADYEGECWPGISSYLDYFNPDARKYYADQYLLTNFKEQIADTGIWNDMNEPAVFNTGEGSMPRNNIHHGGWEHRLMHNMYGLMQTKGTYDGVKRRGDGKLRPFILTRAFFSGSQRYTAMWTGDNNATWEHLQASVKMCLSVSAAGMSFCGSDIGGFFNNPEPDHMARWYQAAAYQPFMRGHGHEATEKREPYRLPEAQRTIVREALRQRYALLPLWYTMFYEHETDGKPIMRPMLSEYPLDKAGFKLDTQYMLSDKLLVAPVLTKDATKVEVHFPSTDGDKKAQLWFNFHTLERVSNETGRKSFDVTASSIPVFQRGGTIIPKKEMARKSTVHMENDPISLFIAVNDEESADGTLYIDDGKSFDYQDKKYLYLKFEQRKNVLSSKKVDKTANYTTGSRLDVVVIAGLNDQAQYKYATIKVGSVETRKDITNITANYLRIEGLNMTLVEEWTLTVSGATQNIVCFGLMALVAAILKFL